MIMTYDKNKIKNILMGVLLLLAVFFFCKWYFSTDDVAKEENKKLKIENQKLEKDREVLTKKNDSIVIHYTTVEKNIEKTLERINMLDDKLGKLRTEVLDSKKEQEATQKEINELLKQIAYLKAHPTKRTGNDLLESLNKKINDK